MHEYYPLILVGAIVGLAKFRTLLRGVNDIVRQIEEIS